MPYHWRRLIYMRFPIGSIALPTPCLPCQPIISDGGNASIQSIVIDQIICSIRAEFQRDFLHSDSIIIITKLHVRVVSLRTVYTQTDHVTHIVLVYWFVVTVFMRCTNMKFTCARWPRVYVAQFSLKNVDIAVMSDKTNAIFFNIEAGRRRSRTQCCQAMTSTLP
jgi:hypothetical protein